MLVCQKQTRLANRSLNGIFTTASSCTFCFFLAFPLAIFFFPISRSKLGANSRNSHVSYLCHNKFPHFLIWLGFKFK